MDSYRNRTCNVLVLGDSHVYWLEQFVAHDLLLFSYRQDVNAIDIVYRGNRGGTVSSMRCDTVFRARRHDLPHAVIVMVGGNDIDKCDVPPQRVGMEVYTLARDLVRCGVNHVTVCQVLRRNSWRHFSYQEGADRVSCVNEFLLAAYGGPGNVAFWKHSGMWQEGADIFRTDGIHFNSLGNFKLYKSVRGAIYQASRLCQPHYIAVSIKLCTCMYVCIIILCINFCSHTLFVPPVYTGSRLHANAI